jgi:hypothetical protein
MMARPVDYTDVDVRTRAIPEAWCWIRRGRVARVLKEEVRCKQRLREGVIRLRAKRPYPGPDCWVVLRTGNEPALWLAVIEDDGETSSCAALRIRRYRGRYLYSYN